MNTLNIRFIPQARFIAHYSHFNGSSSYCTVNTREPSCGFALQTECGKKRPNVVLLFFLEGAALIVLQARV